MAKAVGSGAKIYDFPDMKVSSRSELLGKEIGTQFDWGQRLFAYYGSGDVFDYGEWHARDLKSMFQRDGLAQAVELALTLPIRGAKYDIKPAKGDKGECEFVQSVLMTPDTEGGMKTPMSELIAQITSAQTYRRAFFEKVWKIRESDGKVVYDKIAFRPPATCQARYNDRTGVPNGFRQQVWLFGGNMMLSKNQKVPGYVDIPKIRSYIYTHGKWREPLIGTSEMEISYWVYQTKMKLLYLWYHFLENQALQRIIVYGNDQPEANAYANDIAALKGSGVAGMPHPEQGQKRFEVIENGSDAGQFFSAALNFLETWQVQSVMAGFLNLTTGGGRGGARGGYSMSQDQSSFYLQSRQAVALEMAESLDFEVIRPLVALNFGTQAAFPTGDFGPLQAEEVQALLSLFGQMAAAQTLNVPIPVFDLITERMASILQLDVDQVHQALTSTANQRAEKLAGNPPPGMPPEAASGLGQLSGLADAATAIAGQAHARAGAGAGAPNGAGSSGLPRAIPQANPVNGAPRAPSQPPMVPPPGRMG